MTQPIFVAAFVSLMVGIAVSMLSTEMLPCFSDRAGCGMAGAFRLFVVPVEVIVVSIVLGISAIRRSRKILKLAMWSLCFAGALLLVLVPGFGQGPSAFRNFIELSQLAVPFLAVVVSQWLVLHRHLPAEA
jgi:hypothetical protein